MPVASERNAFSTYRSELGAFHPLSPEEELEFVARWRAGDQKAGAKLIGACLPFVMTIALEYRRWGLPTEDIVQEGNIGLLKAATRFDPARGCRLVTYAAYWIRAEIRDYVVRAYRVVRIGASKAERRALRYYRKTRERDPQLLAQASGLSVARIEQLLPLLTSRESSLDDHPVGEAPLVERAISDEPSPEETMGRREVQHRLRAALESAIADLPARERTIVEERCLAAEPPTLEEVGSRFGISKERVRQLEERAKHRIRQRIEALVPETDLRAFAA
ncbi:MAG: sigma-70 family RNA polymerase sigma factor [Polyangiaceae bacterium]